MSKSAKNAAAIKIAYIGGGSRGRAHRLENVHPNAPCHPRLYPPGPLVAPWRSALSPRPIRVLISSSVIAALIPLTRLPS